MSNKLLLAVAGLFLSCALVTPQASAQQYSWTKMAIDKRVTGHIREIQLPNNRHGVIYTTVSAREESDESRLRAKLGVYDSSGEPEWRSYQLGDYRVTDGEFNHHLVSTGSDLVYFPNSASEGKFYTADSLDSLVSDSSGSGSRKVAESSTGRPPEQWHKHSLGQEFPGASIQDAVADSTGVLLLVRTGKEHHNLRALTHRNGESWNSWETHVVDTGCRYCSRGFSAKLTKLKSGFVSVYLDARIPRNIYFARTKQGMPSDRRDWEIEKAQSAPYSNDGKLPVKLSLFISSGEPMITYYGTPIGALRRQVNSLFLVTVDRPRPYAGGNKTRRVVEYGVRPELSSYGVSGTEIQGNPFIAYNSGKALRIAESKTSLPKSPDDWRKQVLAKAGWHVGNPVVFPIGGGEVGVIALYDSRDRLVFHHGKK